MNRRGARLALGHRAPPLTTTADDRAEPWLSVLDELAGGHVAVMLYGSRARGTSRPSSDIDILQLVQNPTRPFSIGQINVTPYTPMLLMKLSKDGNLFVRHLRDEGIVLSDRDGALSEILKAYSEPSSYATLIENLSVASSILQLNGVQTYESSARRVALHTLRTALYLRANSAQRFEFDVIRASHMIGEPAVGQHLQHGAAGLRVEQIAALALGLLNGGYKTSQCLQAPKDFESAALWATINFPHAGALLESVLAGGTTTDYAGFVLAVA